MESRLYLGLIGTLALDALAVWLITAATLAIGRVRHPNARRLLLALPLAKIAWDLMVLVPGDWAIHRGFDPSHRPPKSIVLSVGLGLWWCLVPLLRVDLTNTVTDGHLYPTDLVYPRLGDSAATGIVLFIVSASLFLVLRRFLLVALESVELSRLLAGSRALDPATLDLPPAVGAALAASRARTVLVPGGRIFAAGVLSPLIVIGDRALVRLSPEERAAAIAHELGHLGSRDSLIALFARLLADVAWFLPFAARRTCQLRFEAERAADRAALALGCDATVLASALCTAAETVDAAPAGAAHGVSVPWLDRALVPCLAEGRCEIERRVRELLVLGPERPAVPVLSRVLRAAAYAALVALSLLARVGGM